MVLNPREPLARPAAIGTTAHTGQVVRSDDTGVWVAPVLGDTRHPIGPCRGATRRTDTGWEQLPAGTTVLLVLTDDGPWVAAHEQEVT